MFWWSTARNHCKHQEKLPKTMKRHKTILKTEPRKQKKHNFQIISQNKVLVVFPGFYSGFELLTTKTTVTKTWKPPKNHEKTLKPLQKNKKTHTQFSNYLSKSRFRGFSWFLQCFGGQELETTIKNQEKLPKTMKKHKTILKTEPRKQQKT